MLLKKKVGVCRRNTQTQIKDSQKGEKKTKKEKLMAQKVLKVRCLEKYARSFQDELSMDENEELTILRTTMSGWWYAENRHGMQGLVPMMPLEILDGDFVSFNDLSMAEYQHIEKTVFGWKIERCTQLVFQNQKNNSEEQCTLLHALRKLFTLVQKPDGRYFFMQQNGIDRLLDIATKTYDIAIQLFCLRNMIYLLGSPDFKRFPTQMNIPNGITRIMDNCKQLVKALELCCDALSNACYQNPLQCKYAAESKCVDILIAVMSGFKQSFGMQYSASRALSNMCVDSQSHKHFKSDDIRNMIENLKSQFPEKEVSMNAGMIGFQQKQAEYAVQVLNVLYFLVQHYQHAQTFALNGGFEVLPKIYNAVGTWDQSVRQCVFALLGKIAEGKGALLFGERLYEGFDMIYTFLYPLPFNEETDNIMAQSQASKNKKNKKNKNNNNNNNNKNNNNKNNMSEEKYDDFGDMDNLNSGFDLKMHFASEFFTQMFNILVMVIQGLATGHQGALQPSLVQGAITRGFLRKNLKKICVGALQQTGNEQLMNCVAALMALSGQAILKLLEDVAREKMRGQMQQSANNLSNGNGGNGGNGGHVVQQSNNQLYGAHGGFISPEAAAMANESSIGIADQIAVDASGFKDVLMKAGVVNDMIRCCMDTTNQTVSNDFLKNTFVAIKFLCLEEVKKWDKENIDYFVDECNVLSLLTHKWYKERDNNSMTFTYTFQSVESGCFLLRGILVTMTRNLTVTEEEKTNEMVKYLAQGQRNDVSPDYIKQLQDGWIWKQKRSQQQSQQAKGKSKQNGKQQGKQQARPQQQQQARQQPSKQQQGQNRGQNQKGDKDDCLIM